jgi:copper(I)-binding protein
VELHEMSMAGGVMRMRALPGGVAIGPGGTLALAPGGDHLMLIGPAHALRAGETVPVNLTFAHAGTIRVQFQVRQGAPGVQR